jgi:DNA-binding response OmpR family regulator
VKRRIAGNAPDASVGLGMALPEETSGADRVLVVDDEPNIRETIAVTLRREGFDVILAETGPEALERMGDQPLVVVLDIMLPGLDGLEVCRQIRRTSSVPILLLSARGEEIDRVVGLEIGADDYLTKPFAMRELVARIRALIRRTRMDLRDMQAQPVLAEPASPLPSNGDELVAGDITIDRARRLATLGGEELDLKPKEFDLLEYFARNPGIVLTREALLREVWGYHHRVDTRTVDVHIRWLRQKLEQDPGVPTRLLTVRGHGYRFLVDHGDA